MFLNQVVTSVKILWDLLGFLEHFSWILWDIFMNCLGSLGILGHCHGFIGIFRDFWVIFMESLGSFGIFSWIFWDLSGHFLGFFGIF